MIDFSYLIIIASVINFDNFVHSSESNVLHNRTIQYSSSVENHINLHIHIISEQIYFKIIFFSERSDRMSQEVTSKTESNCDSKGRSIITKKVIYLTGN
jgi:hypothetical protein